MKRTSAVLFLTAAFLCGYGYGRWYARSPVVAATTGRRVLYYRCPMHPAYRSSHPGAAPCCGMTLQPVYEGDADPPSPAALHVTPQQQELLGVRYGTAEYTPALRLIRGVARVGVNESRVACVQTKLEGFIDQVYVKSVGETVRKGQPLLRIYNRRAYSMAQTNLLDAIMVASGMGMTSLQAASPDARNAARQNVLAARQDLEMLGFTEYQIEAVERAHQPLRSLPIYAPIDGVVIEYNAALNEAVGMRPLLTIADLSNVWVTADFAPADAAGIRPGQNAVLRVPYAPRRAFRGVVDLILPQVNPETRTLSVRLQVDNPGLELKPQMYGEVELRAGTGARKLTVPQEAVIDSGHSETVFIASGEGYLEPREVATGERFGDRIEILRGLAPGERVVTSGNFLLDSEVQLRSVPHGEK
jgi:RND family efflux transporter MFP subunit